MVPENLLSEFSKKTYGQISTLRRRFAELREKSDLFDDEWPEFPFDRDFLRAKVDPLIGTPCPYCGQELTVENYALDHPTPVDRWREFGLKPEQVFAWENTRPICKACNKEKGKLSHREYMALWAFKRSMPRVVANDIRARLIRGLSFRFGAQRKEKAAAGEAF